MHVVTATDDSQESRGLNLSRVIIRKIKAQMPVDYQGAKIVPISQEVRYTRKAMVPDKPDEGSSISFTDWQSDNNQWATYQAPKINGYQSDLNEVPEKEVQVDARSENVVIKYRKIDDSSSNRPDTLESREPDNQTEDKDLSMRNHNKGIEERELKPLTEKLDKKESPKNDESENLLNQMKNLADQADDSQSSSLSTRKGHENLSKDHVIDKIKVAQKSFSKHQGAVEPIQIKSSDTNLKTNAVVAKAVKKYQIVGELVKINQHYVSHRFGND